MSQPLDDYLSRVARELRALPPLARENELREVRSHLEQLIDDGIARGESREVATSNALTTFGGARAVGVSMRDVWEGGVLSWKHILRASFTGSIFNLSVWCASIGLWTSLVDPLSELRSASLNLLINLAFLFSSLIVSLLTGMIFYFYCRRWAWIPNVILFGFLIPCVMALFSDGASIFRIFWGNFSLMIVLSTPTMGIVFLGTLAGNAMARRRRNAKWALAIENSSAPSKNASSS